MPLVRRLTAEQLARAEPAQLAPDCWVHWCVVCGPCLQCETEGGVFTLHRGEPEDHAALLRVNAPTPEALQ